MYHLGRTPGCSFRYCGNKGHGELSIRATDACVLEQAWVQDGWILTKFAKIAQKKSSLKLPKKKNLANIQLSWSIKGLLYGQRGKSRAGKMALSCPLGS